MRPTTTVYEFPFEFSEQTEEVTEMSTVEIEETEYAAFASLLGIRPVARSVPSAEGPRMVKIPTAEVERLRALAALGQPAPSDDDAAYEAFRPYLGIPS